MRVYLDTSVYNRPFDDQKQPRIWLETLAFTLILKMAEKDQVEIVKSQVSDFENSKNPKPIRKRWVKEYLAAADVSQNLTPQIFERATTLEEHGIDAIDALHLASAEEARSEYFITCDDKIIKNYSGGLKALNPVQFILEEGGNTDGKN